MAKSGRSRQSFLPNRMIGFTLLEILIVVALVAILSAVAYPSYLSYITRANRAAAEGFMLEVSNRQERFLLDFRGYATAIGTSPGQLAVTIPANVSVNYTVTTVSPSVRAGAPTPSFDVNAAPTGSQASRDAACGTLTIDETGAKSISGSGSSSTCWRQ